MLPNRDPLLVVDDLPSSDSHPEVNLYGPVDDSPLVVRESPTSRGLSSAVVSPYSALPSSMLTAEVPELPHNWNCVRDVMVVSTAEEVYSPASDNP